MLLRVELRSLSGAGTGFALDLASDKHDLVIADRFNRRLHIARVINALELSHHTLTGMRVSLFNWRLGIGIGNISVDMEPGWHIRFTNLLGRLIPTVVYNHIVSSDNVVMRDILFVS